jgi:hypothetical protein
MKKRCTAQGARWKADCDTFAVYLVPCATMNNKGADSMSHIAFKEIRTLPYSRPAVEKGYANQTLAVNLSNSEISIKPVTEEMKEIFVGGKGFDLWLLWNAVKGHDPMGRS